MTSALLKIAAIVFLTTGCVSFPEAPAPTTAPALRDGHFVSFDGAALAFTRWGVKNPDQKKSAASGKNQSPPSAIILALHGMNDYARTFEGAGPYWAAQAGIVTYAIDQRGFGRNEFEDDALDGSWPGAPILQADLQSAISALRNAHPSSPLYLVGHSMGAAVILSAAGDAPLDVDGVVLAAPAVWGGSQLPLLYRLSANIAAVIAPRKTLTGARAGRQATDNIEVLRAMAEDPYIITETRVKSVLGVVRLMGAAYGASKKTGGNILLLYGENDEIIPDKPIERTARRLCGDVEFRRYEQGWHLLFRDYQARAVWRDVADWIRQKNAAGSGKGMAPAAFVCSDTTTAVASGVAAPRALAKGRLGE